MLFEGITKNKKIRVDTVKRLAIKQLMNNRILKTKNLNSYCLKWTKVGKITGYTIYQLRLNNKGEPDSIRIIDILAKYFTGEIVGCNLNIKLVATSCNFGGKRWWFLCPFIKNGNKCSRRCSIIYLPDDSDCWGCRECHELTYESRKRHGDMFYEYFQKPKKQMEEALAIIPCSRSRKKLIKAGKILKDYKRKLKIYSDFCDKRARREFNQLRSQNHDN